MFSTGMSTSNTISAHLCTVAVGGACGVEWDQIRWWESGERTEWISLLYLQELVPKGSLAVKQVTVSGGQETMWWHDIFGMGTGDV